VQSYTVVLSSYQTFGGTGFLNHYIFQDPVLGTNFTYPNTANGSNFTASLTSLAQPEYLWLAPYIFSSYTGMSAVSAHNIANPSIHFWLSGGSPGWGYTKAIAYADAFRFDNSVSWAERRAYMRTRTSYARNFLNLGKNSFTLSVVFSSANPTKWAGPGWTTSNTKRVISKGHFALSPGYFVSITDTGKVRTGIGSTKTYGAGNSALYIETYGTPITYNDWNQVTITCDRTNNIFACYVNGFKQYMRPALDQPVSYLLDVSGFDVNFSSAAHALSASSLGDMWLAGAAEDWATAGINSSQFYTGLIADAKIYSRVLTQDEINIDRDSIYFLNNNSTDPYSVLTADGGLFFPWGYKKQNKYYDIDIGKFKGPVSITFCPSAIASNIYQILKIHYDYGDGSFSEVDKSIYGDTFSVKTDFVFLSTSMRGSPVDYNSTHTYWPKTDNALTEYRPSISAIAADGTYNVYNITLSTAPDSVYSISDFRIINDADIKNKQKLVVSELNYNNNYLQNIVFAQNKQFIAPTPTVTPTPTPTPTVTPTPTPTPTPTVTPTPTPTPTNTPTVTPTPTPTSTPTVTPTPTSTPTPTPTSTPTETPTPTPPPCPGTLTVTGAGTTAVNNTYTLSSHYNSYILYVSPNYKFLILPSAEFTVPGTGVVSTGTVIVSGGIASTADLNGLSANIFYGTSATPTPIYCANTGAYNIQQGAYINYFSQNINFIGKGSYPTVS
jgi:hypothetical protein